MINKGEPGIRPGLKIGSGYDVHRFTRGRSLVLGGVDIDFDRGLEGHSDADVLLHAVCDAILGAAGLGDLGEHFPDDDPGIKGINSRFLVEKCHEMMKKKGYGIVNLDCTIIAQVPKLGPYKQEIRQSMAGILNMDSGLVNIKATTTERLGFPGREEGIAAECILLASGNDKV